MSNPLNDRDGAQQKCFSLVQSLVTMTLFLRTNLRPYSIAAGQEYYGVIFFSLIATMFDGFAEETLTVRRLFSQ